MNNSVRIYRDNDKPAKQFSGMELQRDRDESAKVYTALFPKGEGKLAAMGTDKYAVANAKNGVNNPSARMMRLFRAMFRAGYPMETSLTLVAHLEAFVRSLYVENVSVQDVLEASRAEQGDEGAENNIQMRLHEDPARYAPDAHMAFLRNAGADMRAATMCAAYARTVK